MNNRAMNIPLSMLHRTEPEDDDHVVRVDPMGAHRAEIDEAIQRREAAILATAAAKKREGIEARQADKRRQLAAAAERRIFDQVTAVGGLRNAS